MLTEISNILSDSDLALFLSLFESEINARYPFSSRMTALAFKESHLTMRESFGYFSLAKKIWKGIDSNGHALGFTVATEKRGGSVKFGPTLILSGKRNLGIGSQLRRLVEDIYQANGFRKAYSTTNLSNRAGLMYLLKIGYKVELHLQNHFEIGKDELVLSRFLKSSQPKPISQTTTSSDSMPADLTFEERRMWSDIENDFDIDATYVNSIRNNLREELCFTEGAFKNKLGKLFVSPCRNCIALAIPKRGGCVKLFPIVLSGSSNVDTGLITDVCRYSGSAIHKLYTLVPARRTGKIRMLKAIGFFAEGLIREPYKRGVDVIHMSFML